MSDRKYYEAYDERYKTAHEAGIRWFGDAASPIVSEMISKYQVTKDSKILELGCGEGRDAQALLGQGYSVLATDISPEVIAYCKKLMPNYADSFQVLDCVKDSLTDKFDFIYAVAVVHMLVLDEDRDAFYHFVNRHLASDGIALICTMGDGNTEMQSDIKTAFDLQKREHEGKEIAVAGTSCRMVTDATFQEELMRNGFRVLEYGQNCIPGQFSEMMYAVVKRERL